MHPEVYMPRAKEVHFFDLNYHKGLEWYRKFFVEARHGRYKAVGEATPFYMYLEEVPERIHNILPGVKLIFILRNPVDRAYSHYWHEVSKGREYLTFEEAIEKEAERLNSGSLFAKQHYSYLDRGRYAVQLNRYRKFFSKDQMLVLIFEEFKKHPFHTLKILSNFIGVDPNYWDSINIVKQHNIGRSPRNWTIHKIMVKTALRVGPTSPLGKVIRKSLKILNTKKGYPPMNPETRRRLQEKFKEYNEMLERQLGRRIPW